MTTSSAHWIDCIRAFLHDPPDKAFDIRGHEHRTCEALAAALNIPVAEARAQAQKQADWLASACERLPLPVGTLWADGKPVPDDQQAFNRIKKLERTSPINGSPIPINETVARTQAVKQIERIRDLAVANPEMRLRALAMWRLLPETLGSELCQLPGDTRLTDHSIIDHADAAMAACAALRSTRHERTEVRAPTENDAMERGLQSASTGTSNSASLLVFSLGPVQDFIVKGRSLRDLWTGSYLLSWLTFHAMTPLIDTLGPWCLTSPGLRGNAMLDWWLARAGVRHADGSPLKPALDALRCAGLPNTFTALVPSDQAQVLAAQVTAAFRGEWHAICQAVHDSLLKSWGSDGWAAEWKEQCESLWDARTVIMPLVTITDSNSIAEGAKVLRTTYSDLLGDLPKSVTDASDIAAALQNKGWAPGYVTKEGQGLWTMANELAQRLMEADKRTRLVPPHAPDTDTREKCALFSGFAVMGPQGDTVANKTWWKNRHLPAGMIGRIRVNERLSAPGLVKRCAFGAYFRPILGKDDFQDTREAAFAGWIHHFTTHLRSASGQAIGGIRWSAFARAIDRANDTKADEAIDPWMACEVLDPAAKDRGQWLGWDDSDVQQAQKARQTLMREAASIGLPEPRPYYAVLVADGDQMGKILRGESGPPFEKAYHSEMVKALRGLGVLEGVLKRVRPQGMASQLAFSRSLGEFTQRVGKDITKAHGTCVYAGGDDVLAVLPVSGALNTAAEMAQTFKTWVPGATLSAGLAIVHCQEDLRIAIEEARKAEQEAKHSGRDGLCLRIARRSGDITSAYMPWLFRIEGEHTRNLAHDWQRIAEILRGQSDRWVHHLIRERDALYAVPMEAVWARIQHHLLHGQEGDLRERGELNGLLSHVKEAWGDNASSLKQREGFTRRAEQHRTKPIGLIDPAHVWLVDQFLTWCQHAAWLAKFQMSTPALENQS